MAPSTFRRACLRKVSAGVLLEGSVGAVGGSVASILELLLQKRTAGIWESKTQGLIQTVFVRRLFLCVGRGYAVYADVISGHLHG